MRKQQKSAPSDVSWVEIAVLFIVTLVGVYADYHYARHIPPPPEIRITPEKLGTKAS